MYLRAARCTGGLSVEKFLKALTYQRVGPKRAGPLIDATAQIARAEGMEGHALTAELRRQGVAQPESGEATQ
jgi:sulfopropanediol 3-dehydrogenase